MFIMNSLISGLGAGYLAGIDALTNELTQKYIGPILICFTVVMALVFLFKKEIRPMLSFLGVALLAAVIIYLAPWAFGPNGPLVNRGKELGQTAIN